MEVNKKSFNFFLDELNHQIILRNNMVDDTELSKVYDILNIGSAILKLCVKLTPSLINPERNDTPVKYSPEVFANLLRCFIRDYEKTEEILVDPNTSKEIIVIFECKKKETSVFLKIRITIEWFIMLHY